MSGLGLAAVGQLPDGPAIHGRMLAPIEAYLTEHPDDWTGAYRLMLGVLSEKRADLVSPLVEAALRDDGRIIKPPTVVVARGTNSRPRGHRRQLTAEIGRPALVVDAANDHEIYLLEPGVLAGALADQ